MVVALLLIAAGQSHSDGRKIPGPSEGGDPLAVDEHGVPTHVIEVQMGAEHGIDRIGGVAGVGEMLEKRGRRRAMPR